MLSLVTWAVNADQLRLIGGILLALLVSGSLAWRNRRQELRLAQRQLQAEARARTLLEHFLTAEERAKLTDMSFIDLASQLVPGRIYRVWAGYARAQVYQDGWLTGSLCIRPTRWVPESDLLLMHKLMIEGSEREYLRIANFFESGGGAFFLRQPNTDLTRTV